MKEFKGTPGPWFYRKSQSCVGTVDNSDTQSYGMMLTVAHIDEYDHSQYEETARLIAASYDLLIEHHEWAKEIGKVYMAVIQGDMVEAKTILEDMIKISFATGEPVAESPAIAKALGEDHE